MVFLVACRPHPRPRNLPFEKGVPGRREVRRGRYQSWYVQTGLPPRISPPSTRQTSGSLAELRLCMVMHVDNSGGSRAWQGLLGRRPDWGMGPPGQRVSAKDPPSIHVGAPADLLSDWSQVSSRPRLELRVRNAFDLPEEHVADLHRLNFLAISLCRCRNSPNLSPRKSLTCGFSPACRLRILTILSKSSKATSERRDYPVVTAPFGSVVVSVRSPLRWRRAACHAAPSRGGG